MKTRDVVEQMVKENPSLSAAEIGREVGVSRERVRKILEELGYQLEWRKRRRGKV